MQEMNKYLGKTIANIALVDYSFETNRLLIEFQGMDNKVYIQDEGRSCCEDRYMSCDDDLSYLIGSVLQSVQVKDMGEKNNDEPYDVHEEACIEIQTAKGFVTIMSHNIHNGYYGGFIIRVSEG